MSPERGKPWYWRLIQNGFTRTFEGNLSEMVLDNPGRIEVVEFRGKLYKKTPNGLILFSNEEVEGK